MDLKLADKTALITGSSSGLGFAVARLLSQEGAKVAVNGRNADKLKVAEQEISKASQGDVISVPGDVTEPSFPGQLIEKVIDTWGGLDILVTNAGGPPPGPFESFDDETWQKGIDLSFFSHVRLIRAALPYLKKSSHSSVLTITSISVRQPIPNMVLSNSIRAATVGLTKTLALELGEYGIRFNSILPSWTETQRIFDLLGDRAKRNNSTIEKEMKIQAAESPLGRMGTPQEFANAAVFLVSPAASYLTGVMLSFDGGMYKGLL